MTYPHRRPFPPMGCWVEQVCGDPAAGACGEGPRKVSTCSKRKHGCSVPALALHGILQTPACGCLTDCFKCGCTVPSLALHEFLQTLLSPWLYLTGCFKYGCSVPSLALHGVLQTPCHLVCLRPPVT